MAKSRKDYIKDIKMLMPELKSVDFQGFMGKGYVSKDELIKIEERLSEIQIRGLK